MIPTSDEIIKLELKPRPWVILGGMAFSIVMLVAIAWSLPESPAKLSIFGLLFALVLTSGIRRWRREPRLQVTNTRIQVLSPVPWSTPLQNISHILLASHSGIHFQFQDLELVESRSLRLKFQENMERFGWHCEISGTTFSHGLKISRACNIIPEELSDAQSLEQSSSSVEVFHSILAGESPNPIVCKALVGVNLLVFVLMAVFGVSLFTPLGENLIDWGANFGPSTFHHQPWRLLTSVFLHIGLVHLGINMLVLYRIGPFLEMILGRWSFLVIYLASGVGGAMASVWWNELGISAGASGALFGMFGGLLGYLAVRPPAVPMEVGGKLRSWAFQFIVLNIALMFGLSGIDQAAHVGGAFFGFVLGLFLGLLRKLPFTLAGWVGHLAFVAFGTILLIDGWVVVDPAVSPPLETYRLFEEFREEEKRLQGIFATGYEKVINLEMTEEQFALVLEQETIPAWESYLGKFELCIKVPAKFRPWFPDFLDYLRAQVKAQELRLKAIRTRDPRIANQAREQNLIIQNIIGTIEKKMKAEQ